METLLVMLLGSLHLQVASLPMRDGNGYTGLDRAVQEGCVASLPMRDGNVPWKATVDGQEYVASLPMRDGNWNGEIISPREYASC